MATITSSVGSVKLGNQPANWTARIQVQYAIKSTTEVNSSGNQFFWEDIKTEWLYLEGNNPEQIDVLTLKASAASNLGIGFSSVASGNYTSPPTGYVYTHPSANQYLQTRDEFSILFNWERNSTQFAAGDGDIFYVDPANDPTILSAQPVEQYNRTAGSETYWFEYRSAISGGLGNPFSNYPKEVWRDGVKYYDATTMFNSVTGSDGLTYNRSTNHVSRSGDFYYFRVTWSPPNYARQHLVNQLEVKSVNLLTMNNATSGNINSDFTEHQTLPYFVFYDTHKGKFISSLNELQNNDYDQDRISPNPLLTGSDYRPIQLVHIISIDPATYEENTSPPVTSSPCTWDENIGFTNRTAVKHSDFAENGWNYEYNSSGTITLGTVFLENSEKAFSQYTIEDYTDALRTTFALMNSLRPNGLSHDLPTFWLNAKYYAILAEPSMIRVYAANSLVKLNNPTNMQLTTVAYASQVYISFGFCLDQALWNITTLAGEGADGSLGGTGTTGSSPCSQWNESLGVINHVNTLTGPEYNPKNLYLPNGTASASALSGPYIDNNNVSGNINSGSEYVLQTFTFTTSFSSLPLQYAYDYFAAALDATDSISGIGKYKYYMLASSHSGANFTASLYASDDLALMKSKSNYYADGSRRVIVFGFCGVPSNPYVEVGYMNNDPDPVCSSWDETIGLTSWTGVSDSRFNLFVNFGSNAAFKVADGSAFSDLPKSDIYGVLESAFSLASSLQNFKYYIILSEIGTDGFTVYGFDNLREAKQKANYFYIDPDEISTRVAYTIGFCGIDSTFSIPNGASPPPGLTWTLVNPITACGESVTDITPFTVYQQGQAQFFVISGTVNAQKLIDLIDAGYFADNTYKNVWAYDGNVNTLPNISNYSLGDYIIVVQSPLVSGQNHSLGIDTAGGISGINGGSTTEWNTAISIGETVCFTFSLAYVDDGSIPQPNPAAGTGGSTSTAGPTATNTGSIPNNYHWRLIQVTIS